MESLHILDRSFCFWLCLVRKRNFWFPFSYVPILVEEIGTDKEQENINFKMLAITRSHVVAYRTVLNRTTSNMMQTIKKQRGVDYNKNGFQ